MAPVPRQLKAAALRCLAALSCTAPSVAFNIWLKVENLLPKPQTSIRPTMVSQSFQSGIAIEIEDIEVKNEEYPITISFLRLMKELFRHILYNNSVSQQTSPENCLSFILNSILLKCCGRVYKNEEEKWLIVKYALKIIHRTIVHYEPLKDGPNAKCSFLLMNLLLQESSLFRFMSSLLEDIIEIFESRLVNISASQKLSQNLLKNCSKGVFDILTCISEKENEYLDMMRDLPGSPLAILVKLETLFGNVNPKTNVIDRLETVVKFVAVQEADISLQVMRLLASLCRSNPKMAQQMLLQLESSKSNLLVGDFLIYNFVECVSTDNQDLRTATLEFILAGLECYDSYLVYNISHHLLGIDRKSVILKEPGSLGQTFNCLHAILDFFINRTAFILAEEGRLSMQIIWKLCSVPATFDATLRFMRTSYDFLMLYLQNWDKNSRSKAEHIEVFLPELSWFLRVLAIEIKTTSDQNLKSHCSSYIKYFLSDTKRRRILDILYSFAFSHEHPSMPNWESFEVNELWKIISECSETSQNVNVINLKLLHQKLVNEVKAAGPQFGIAKTNQIQNEIKGILSYVTNLNNSYLQMNAKIQYIHSWQELTEVIISTKSLDIFDLEVKCQILVEIIHEAFSKITHSSTISQMYSPLSSVILFASSALHSIPQSNSPVNNIMACAKTIAAGLDIHSDTWSHHSVARINLFSAFLHLLCSVPSELRSDIKIGQRFLQKLCKDLLSAHEVIKVLAASILNESDFTWFGDLAGDGTVRLLIDSLLTDDRDIKANKCEPQSRTFYTFDSKIVSSKQCSSNVFYNSFL